MLNWRIQSHISLIQLSYTLTPWSKLIEMESSRTKSGQTQVAQTIRPEADISP